MSEAKDLIVKPIKSSIANDFVKTHHYSGKVAQNSQLHLGVFLDGVLHGVMQFGPSLDKRKIQGLVSGTLWHEFLELNRMAFDDILPRNSESRALAVAFRMIRKNAPQVKWIISFADGTQCGDGTIYRAAGFVLTSVKENNQLIELPRAEDLNPEKLIEHGCNSRDIEVLREWLRSLTGDDGRVVQHAHNAKFIPFSGQASVDKPRPQCHIMSIQGGTRPSSLLQQVKDIMRKVSRGATTSILFDLMGGVALQGFQLRYIYFIDKSYRARLTVPELPFSEIERRGAKMYKGEKPTNCGQGETDNAAETNLQTGGASPT